MFVGERVIDVNTVCFLLRGGEITGFTPTGRATARLLNMNAPQRVKLREQWVADGGSL